MGLNAIRLRFRGPVHFGRGGEDLDETEVIYHSDSLKSALYAVGHYFFSSWKDPEYFFNSFRISSCFPYAFDEFFLPRPYLDRKIDFTDEDELSKGKKAKRISFFSKKLFEQYLAFSVDLSISNKQVTAGGRIVCEKEETAKNIFYVSETQQRVQVPTYPSTQQTLPFYADRIHFQEGCGLYFLAEFASPQIREEVLSALSILGDYGIGTDRTVGNGFFEFNKKTDVFDFSLDVGSVGNAWINLGLFLPRESDMAGIDWNRSHWQLMKRGGYIAGASFSKFAHLRKKNIWMFQEGSVFISTQALSGRYENLRPEWNDADLHAVWRDGQSLFLNFSLNNS